MRMSARRTVVAAMVAALAVSTVGCSRLWQGAAVGAGAGAGVGALIGSQAGDTAKGAIIGAAVGGTAGAIIGRQMEKQADELEGELENAEIIEAGEGIIVKFDSGLLFGFDSAELQPAARDNLSGLASNLQRYERTNVLIIGHTDATGSESYNEKLSRERAQSAAQFLVGNGVAAYRIDTEGKGETDPIATNETEEGRTQNRRVEVVIFASDEWREEVQAQSSG